MTFENIAILDRAANLTGAVALIGGLLLGAAMFIVQSI
jgi:hypothetical protein